MAEVKWIKITTNVFDNRKIKKIRRLPEGNNIALIWFMVLTKAGESNQNGGIYFMDNIPYTEEDLAEEFGFSITITKLALNVLEQMQMIERFEDVIYIKNWNEYQNIQGLDKIREQNRLRVAKHRENKKKLLECNVTSNVTVTQSNATDIDIDIDKELDIEIDKDKDINNNVIILTKHQEEFFKILKKIHNYNIDINTDLEMYNKLTERYPTLDLVEAIKDFENYKLDKPLKNNSNARSQINNSFKKYVEWGKCLKGASNGGYKTNNKQSTNRSTIQRQHNNNIDTSRFTANSKAVGEINEDGVF